MPPNALSIPILNRIDFRAWRIWAKKNNIGRKFTIGLILAAVLSGITTYGAFTSSLFSTSPNTIFVLMNINIILLLSLGAIVIRKLVKIWMARREGQAGSKMHTRMVLLFSAVAIAPTIVVAIFSALFFNFGVNTWFSELVTTALSESREVAEAYMEEHQQVIRGDVLAMANDLNRQAGALLGDRVLFGRAVQTHAALRNLNEVLVFDGTGEVLARSGLTFVLELEPIPEAAMAQAKSGDVALLISEDDNRVRALVRLDRFIDTYLYVGRYVEPRVLNHIANTTAAVGMFDNLQKNRTGLQISFAAVYFTVALLLLVSSVWVGLSLATQMTEPVSQLVQATERIRQGDLKVQIDEKPFKKQGHEEISALTRAFNRMTRQLETQRGHLISTNTKLDERARFIEAVLSGVSAGIIGLDAEGNIQYPNKKADELLGVKLSKYVDKNIQKVIPEFAGLLERAKKKPDAPQEAQIRLTADGKSKNLMVRVTTEIYRKQITGFVITFDDVTDLISAQRIAAWADVARRLAHEIRNPLTPIQLSTERLRKNYAGQITEKREAFENYTDIIIRQVDDLRQMLDEFSSFARMPAPEMTEQDINRVVADAVMLMRQSHPEIEFVVSKQKEPVYLYCDSRQVRQVLINVLKNAAEAIDENDAQSDKGKVTIDLTGDETKVVVEVKDNGKGLPKEDSDRLTEPYITSRQKGTGLGLAVVAKIMEDHNGRIRIENNRQNTGAKVTLVFERQKDEIEETLTELATKPKTEKKVTNV